MRSRDDLRPAQLAMIEEVKTHPDGIMVLGMGAGKTAALLTAAQDLKEAGEIDNVIVLAPARVVDNVWPREPAKWSHIDLTVIAVTGTPAQRKRIMDTSAADVLVVSIDNVKWLVDYLKKDKHRDLSRTLLGIDEISRFKDPGSTRAQKLRNFAERFNGVWGLTGTPRPNGYEDLFNPVKIVGGLDAWGIRSFDMWRRKNFYPLDYHGYRWEPHEFTLPALERIAQEWLVHAPASDLQKPRLNTGDDFTRRVRLTDEQLHHYNTMMGELYARAGDDTPWLVQAMSQGVASGKLTQIVQGFLYQDDADPVRFKDNPKLDELLEMDANLGGDSAVVCYGFRDEIEVLNEALKHRRLGLLGGGVSTARANTTIEAWNRGEIDRLLLHPASAGHGIELQFGGHHMIWFHPTWSSEMYDQTVKRLDRPGQADEVFNWHILAEGTVDDIKYARVEHKLADEDAFRQILRAVV